ncbi:GNAT family N-acetyltransferase [Taibaiella sp. KBW10]|uniref:GNAT family N-acetyltransferase n=1 Tax=Taibaiella sp. KBW10 TaxID=2153357 RepID=UPI000F59E944|nr:GNAT family N-acetyltransferase [Taibaiella sp. KBW10]RQO32243.1 GNAT family N-acetyltransferase [Taibaiella sp. KBW10]
MEMLQFNNETKGSFQAMIDGAKAGTMTYSWAGTDKIIIDHTEVDPAYKGKGVGNELLNAAVDFARAQQIKIMPLCPFAKSVFDKTPSIHDVLL